MNKYYRRDIISPIYTPEYRLFMVFKVTSGSSSRHTKFSEKGALWIRAHGLFTIHYSGMFSLEEEEENTESLMQT